jgi:outer membrane protein
MRKSFMRSFLPAAIMAVLGTPLSISAQCLPQRLDGVACRLPERPGDGLLAAAAQQPGTAPTQVRRLSVDEAVRLAAENNLGIQIARYDPQIQDLNVAQAQSAYVPSVTNDFQSVNRTQPNQNFLAGALTTNEDQVINTTGVAAQLPWGGNYTVGLNNLRSESNNFSATRNPVLQSRISATVNQPLLRDFKIDSIRQQIQVSVKNREIADLDLRDQLTVTSRAVRNAYWSLAYQIAALEVARQSLDLANESLRNTRSRVEIGTTPPIDIVADEAEVAQRREAVIVAEAQIATSEDTLRALVFDPSAPDFWSIRIQPEELPAFRSVPVDVNAAIRNALDRRSDLARVRKNLEITDVNIAFARNQTLPDVSANLTYNAIGIGGREIERADGDFGPGTGPPTGGFVTRGFGSVLGDLFQYNYPTWTVTLNVSYPIGRSQQEAALARTRVQRSQAQTQLRNQQLQVETEVRQRARQVQTNQQRVESTRASRELMDRRLEAEQRKFAAGTSTNFLVFQAQRDLAQARNNELRAILDYNQSVVDLETVQEVPVR